MIPGHYPVETSPRTNSYPTISPHSDSRFYLILVSIGILAVGGMAMLVWFSK